MLRRFATLVFVLAISAQSAFGDWHHGHGSSLGSSPDPNFDAFLLTSLLVIAASGAILFLAGPLLILWGRRIRDTLWIVPLANLVLYVLSISVQPYPGGFAARFERPGLLYTIAEMILLLAGSLVVTLILAATQWLVRTTRSRLKNRKAGDEPSPPVPPTPRD